ncbi:MAG: OmpA family protein [candidate division Zixibacteria bacterium]
MRKIIIYLLVVCLFVAAGASGRELKPRYRFGPVYGLGNIKTAEKPYTFNHAWGFIAGLNGNRFMLNFSLLTHKNYSDSAASGNFQFFGDQNEANFLFKTLRLGFDADLRLKTRGRLRPTLGAGLGYIIYNVTDPVADTTVKVIDDKNNTVDFNAAEMFISGSVGLEMKASPRWFFHLKTTMDFLTGIGTSFSDATNDWRPRTEMRFSLAMAYLFGTEKRKEVMPPTTWSSSDSWKKQDDTQRPDPAERDSDGDGINDRSDKCPNTPRGAYIDDDGCPDDSDGDGVFDGLDDCPRTPRSAYGYVDIFGCPIDSDYDGVPDYKDQCTDGPVGALVDESGCPTDSDGDGVYDGIDDCPNTEEGIEVDERGCIDISFLSQPYVVNVDYLPGSFEVDERTKQRLQPLIRKLKILSHVKITINGYTDNVGPAEGNQTVSQRRANRMRDWLTTQGIVAEQMTARGRGESNFIASNNTAEGRARNRRIELVFEK